MDKAALRKSFLPKRAGAFCGDPAEVAARLAKLLPDDDFVLAPYLPIRGEWDPWPVVKALGKIRQASGVAEVETAIPLTPKQPGPLTFKLWAPGQPTVEGLFKTQEPAPSAPDVSLDRLVFLVPGVCIDPLGYRLGYGGGYYDRTFAQLGVGLDRKRLIGFMFDEQISEQPLPIEPTDVPLGYHLTPTQTRKFI